MDVKPLSCYRWLLFFQCSVCLLCPSVSYGADVSGFIDSEVVYSSNVESASTSTPEDTLLRTGMGLSLAEERKRLRANANLRLDHERYIGNTYEDETSLTSGFGLFSVDLVEDFLNWQATFNRTDVLSDSAEDENLDNREFRTIFRTGPTLQYAVSRSMNLSLSANYVNVNNSDEAVSDSQRADAALALDYAYNSKTTVFLGAQHDQILESDDNQDIKKNSVSIGFSRTINDGQFRFNVGGQKVDSSDDSTNNEETDSNFIDFLFTKNNLLGHRVNLSYLEEVSDTAIGFDVDESSESEIGSRTAVASSTDIEVRKRLSLTISRDFTDFAYDISGIYQESDFERSNASERYRNLIIGLESKLYPRLTTRFEHTYEREDFSRASDGEDVSRAYRVLLSYQTAKKVNLTSRAEYIKVDNDESQSRESEEFVVGIGVVWRFL